MEADHDIFLMAFILGHIKKSFFPFTAHITFQQGIKVNFIPYLAEYDFFRLSSGRS